MNCEYIYAEETLQNGETYIGAVAVYTDFQTVEEKKQEIISRGLRIVTKKDYDAQTYRRVYSAIKKALDEGNVGEAMQFLRWNGNNISQKAFYDITGIKLSPTMKVRIPQLKEYFGEKYSEWERKRAEERARKAAEFEAEETARHQEFINNSLTEWKNGSYVNSSTFLVLCDHFGIEMHPRTKGYIRNKVTQLSKDGSYYRIRDSSKSSFVWNVINELNKAAA